MSNLNSLVNKVLEDVKSEANSIAQKAEAEQSKIINNSKAKAEAEKAEMLEKAKSEAKTRKDRVISNAELKVRNNMLDAKQKVIDRVFDTALEKLSQLPDKQYLEFVKNSIINLDIYGDEEMIVNADDKNKINSDFINELNSALKAKGKKGEIRISSEQRKIKGGFILSRKGIEINNTFEALVQSMKDELEQEVIKILFS
jgi:V/A-type H+-transporting ATPase subunit E